jgi:hypothetical protein
MITVELCPVWQCHRKHISSSLMDEIRVLARSSFLTVLQGKVQRISNTPVEFMIKLWTYIEGVVFTVLAHHCDNYPSLQSSSKRAAGNLIS